MIQHVVVFRFNDRATPERVAAFCAALDDLAAVVSGIVDFRYGADAGVRDTAEDFGIAALFENEEALMGYLGHPDHVQILNLYANDIVAEKHSVQFAVSSLENQ